MYISLRLPKVCQKDESSYDEQECLGLNTPQLAQEAGGVTWNWGRFIQTTINFCLVLLTLFFIVKAYFKIFKAEKAKLRDCQVCSFEILNQACFFKIDERATRCGYCTSEVFPVARQGLGIKQTADVVDEIESSIQLGDV
jgi:hypothetical protein